MRLKKTFALMMLAIGLTSPTIAQIEYQAYPHAFIGVQGGIQTTLTNYNRAKLLTPTASISGGYWFTPVVATRLHVNGAWNKGGLNANGDLQDYKYNYNYITTDLDVMLNLVNLFGHKDTYPVGLNLIGGIGLNTAWNNDDAFAVKDRMPFAWSGTRFSHNARVGLQLEYNICRNIGVNLEVDANSLSDRYNSKTSNKDDWQLTAQLGVAFKFAHKKIEKKPEPEPEPEEIWETRIDTIWYDSVYYADRYENGKNTWTVNYGLRESEMTSAEEQLRAIGEFLKDHTECKINLTSYADAGTGNPDINITYSQQRAEKAAKALVDAGVDSTIITTDWKGDTVQPFPDDNDKNRCTIIEVTGLQNVKDKKVIRKFKTQEVRYRVQ